MSSKVLFLLPTAGGGGAEMHVVRLANHLNRERFLPTIAVLRSGGGYERHLRSDVPLHVLNPAWVRSSTASCWLGIFPLRRLLERLQPDLVCSMLPNTHAVVQRAMAGLPRPPRVVLGVQNNVSIELANNKSLPGRLDGAVVDHAYQSADAIVALSEGVGADFSRHYPGAAPKVSVAYNIGCDASIFALAAEPLKDIGRPDGPLLVACGRLTPQKDYPTLLRAMKRVLQSRAATLWILGKGREEPRLKRFCEDLGLGESVKFLGFRANPFQYMAVADVFVLSSAWEGFGNVIVEAMACGTPVVATRCPYGPEEILGQGRFGDLVNVGDVNALADAILAMLDDPERRSRLARTGRQRAQAFGPEGICRVYEQAFAKAIGK